MFVSHWARKDTRFLAEPEIKQEWGKAQIRFKRQKDTPTPRRSIVISLRFFSF